MTLLKYGYLLRDNVPSLTYVQPAIFEDIAQEAVNLCNQSLVTAAGAIKARSPPNSIESQLFLIRHLLILKEMTQNLDFATKNPDRTLDLSGVTGEPCLAIQHSVSFITHMSSDTLASMLSRTTSLLPNALFASLGMPKEENLADVKHVGP